MFQFCLLCSVFGSLNNNIPKLLQLFCFYCNICCNIFVTLFCIGHTPNFHLRNYTTEYISLKYFWRVQLPQKFFENHWTTKNSHFIARRYISSRAWSFLSWIGFWWKFGQHFQLGYLLHLRPVTEKIYSQLG